ncbi:hypothetical protein CF_17 [Curtobacterium phage Ayka]|nr:hypothetical protein CF_17 [Curtobacterium phage Ayka]
MTDKDGDYGTGRGVLLCAALGAVGMFAFLAAMGWIHV